MDPSENIQELKETAQTAIVKLQDNELLYAFILFAILLILVKGVDVAEKGFRKKGHILATFLAGCLKVFLVVTIGLRIFSLIPVMKEFTSQIVLSSSLIVVVLGFVFQEGLSNIVHGFIISVFHPFEIGDRISVTVDGEKITGYVTQITTRHTVIRNVVNSAHVIVPNAKMDLAVIDNSYFSKGSLSTAFLDAQITYESDMERALFIMEEAVRTHPLVEKARKEKEITDPVSVLIRELAPDGICLRAIVPTLTVEENFRACSDLRRQLVHRFESEPDIEFAYPHVQIAEKGTKKIVR